MFSSELTSLTRQAVLVLSFVVLPLRAALFGVYTGLSWSGHSTATHNEVTERKTLAFEIGTEREPIDLVTSNVMTSPRCPTTQHHH